MKTNLYTLKRTVKYYEHCTIEADSFQDAVDQWLNNPESFDGQWEDSQLGEDETLDGVENEEGIEVDVDDDGHIIK